MNRRLTAIALPALVALLVPAAAAAATRDVWVAATPTEWNAVPNARDAIHGLRFDPAATTFPTVVYRRYSRGWKKPLRLAYEAGAGAGRFNGPLIRARVGDKLRIHFKNLDTLTAASTRCTSTASSTSRPRTGSGCRSIPTGAAG